MKIEATTNELQESTRLDVALFALSVVVGTVAHFVIRAWLGDGAQAWITAVLLGVMVLYATVVIRVPRLRVRMDQAGDNAYYLGLLFTLSSMAFALNDFRATTEGGGSAAGVQQIISNFGVALATTIVGIFLRVALHQMRVDPADLEAVTRLELTEAAERLRATLDTATTDLATFHLEVQQRQSDVMSELSSTVQKTAAAMNQHTTDATTKLTTATEEKYHEILTGTRDLTSSLGAIAAEALAAVQRLKAVEPPPQTLSRRLDKIAISLENVAAQSERTANALGLTTDATTRAVDGAARTSEILEKLAVQMRDEQADVTDRLGRAASSLTAALEPFSSRLEQVLTQLVALEKAVSQSIDESLRAQHATVQVINNLATITRDVTNVLRSTPQDPYARS